MAIRKIREDGDPVLRKKCKEVKNIDDRILELLDDMKETMYKADGVGLAAPQVGILKRIVVIDIGEGPIELINPVIVSESGKQIKKESCLSIINVSGEVERPKRVVAEALDRNGSKISIQGKGLMAIALCHELDHLEGILFIDKAIEIIRK